MVIVQELKLRDDSNNGNEEKRQYGYTKIKDWSSLLQALSVVEWSKADLIRQWFLL